MLPEVNKTSDLDAFSAKEKKMLSDLYYYSLINQKITGDLDFRPFIEVYNEKDKLVRVDLLTPNEKKKIEEKAKKFLIDFKVNLFIDEASSVHALL